MSSVSYRIKSEVYTKTKGCCAHCGRYTELTLDHVVPKSLGGKNRAANLIPLCRECNNNKGNKFVQIFTYYKYMYDN